MENQVFFFFLITFSGIAHAQLPSLFQVVKFPNDPCETTDGGKNGTCYSESDCSSRGGVKSGTCASGFGVCCVFSVGCGGASSENCTYFEATSVGDGECKATICKNNPGICQIRLDFDTFVISGPSTITLSVGKIIAGQLQSATGKKVNNKGNCITDVFSISNIPNVPNICGTLTGDHVYFDLTNTCHNLNFNFGQNAIGVSKATRQFSIKVTQISCNSKELRAPQGCTQWFTGNSGTGSFKTFNFDQGIHMANQHQIMCVRREQGNCAICYYAASDTDIQLSGKANSVAKTKDSLCCAYGTNGMKSTGPYDCIVIPGAVKDTKTTSYLKAVKQCGRSKGIVSADAGDAKTVCSKSSPFRIEFHSDGFELAEGAIIEGPSKGAKIQYFQKPC